MDAGAAKCETCHVNNLQLRSCSCKAESHPKGHFLMMSKGAICKACLWFNKLEHGCDSTPKEAVGGKKGGLAAPAHCSTMGSSEGRVFARSCAQLRLKDPLLSLPLIGKLTGGTTAGVWQVHLKQMPIRLLEEVFARILCICICFIPQGLRFLPQTGNGMSNDTTWVSGQF